MPRQVDVYYDGWGEHWRWGSLVTTTALNGRPLIAFEYSDEAKAQGLELCSYTLPLQGPSLRRDFPAHQLALPGPVYDSLPDGWGMLLMDRLFKRRGLNPARIGPLERLAYIGNNAMGAMSFEPVAEDPLISNDDIALQQLASDVREVLNGEGGPFLQRLLQVGGSPQGARPKALLYGDASTGVFSTQARPDLDAWLVKFPARQEHPEVCAIETVYAECLRRCGIQTPDCQYFRLADGQAAFATKRFDRKDGLRVPMQSLAAFTGADFQNPGSLDYSNFLRATRLCTNDVRQQAVAFERAVFNIVFNNRDDHPKNFAYVMNKAGAWTLAPAYDVTYCDGPGGYHQMDIMGEALEVTRKDLCRLGEQETELSSQQVAQVIDRICEVSAGFSALARDMLPEQISAHTLGDIARQISENVARLNS
ncbi:type II toxin-antitoxin system HipA family toxin [Pseudomonas sp. HR96]|uniref:type II toxin-antitoxin system HipA family toxin n=1 Tax=Pseudomonas sp. HR96 TaxID=1027966 RepID=UPI002A747B68|nr:type II toxin-antitoxin system HipA family toxin [Pseudomonas sp. HR96]WPP00351.1 type II toxin-antitoxin system HipA family toxin [Pseudomonas sp. HR96]